MTDGNDKRFLPLQGLKVAEIGTGIALSHCGLQLADLGSEVIKPEPMTDGDPMRKSGDGTSSENRLFVGLNRGKKSVCLDHHGEAGMTILSELVKKVDICLITYESAKSLNLSYEVVRATNPLLIYCSISSLGESGPYRERSATELEIQGLAGYQCFLGKSGETPVRLGGDICETIAGMQAFMAVLTALFSRKREQRGQAIRISLLRAAASFAYYLPAFADPDDWLGYMVSGPTDDPERGYRTADKPVLWGFGLTTPEKARKGWNAFCERLEDFSWMLEDPYWAEHGAAMIGLGRDAQENKPMFESTFERMRSQDVINVVKECGGVAAPFNDYDALFRDEQIQSLEMTREVEQSEFGSIKILRQPWVFSSGSAHSAAGSPALGGHTNAILEMLGYASGEIEELAKKGVIQIR